MKGRLGRGGEREGGKEGRREVRGDAGFPSVSGSLIGRQRQRPPPDSIAGGRRPQLRPMPMFPAVVVVVVVVVVDCASSSP